MRKNLLYYRIMVKRLKFRSPDQMSNDESVFLTEGDTVMGYLKHAPIVGKYVDVWFSPVLDEYEKDNYVTLGRVTKIEPARDGSGLFLVTKLGRFIIEEVICERRQEVASNDYIQ